MSEVEIPPTVTVENLSGKWALDKTRTTGVPESLELQGIPWLVRKIINGASPVSTLTHEGDSMTMVTAAPGVPISTTESRKIDWTERENKLSIFGTVTGASRTIQLDASHPIIPPYELHDDVDIDETDDDREWLSSEWVSENGVTKLLETQGKSLSGTWVCRQIWGFMLVDGQRKHVRKLITWNKGKKVRAVMYHLYLGPATP